MSPELQHLADCEAEYVAATKAQGDTDPRVEAAYLAICAAVRALHESHAKRLSELERLVASQAPAPPAA